MNNNGPKWPDNRPFSADWPLSILTVNQNSTNYVYCYTTKLLKGILIWSVNFSAILRRSNGTQSQRNDHLFLTFYGQFSVQFGCIFDPFLMRLFNRFLVHFWFIFGPFLVHFWSIFGPFLVHFWSIFGPFLVHFWSIFGLVFGSVLGQFLIWIFTFPVWNWRHFQNEPVNSWAIHRISIRVNFLSKLEPISGRFLQNFSKKKFQKYWQQIFTEFIASISVSSIDLWFIFFSAVLSIFQFPRDFDQFSFVSIQVHFKQKNQIKSNHTDK